MTKVEVYTFFSVIFLDLPNVIKMLTETISRQEKDAVEELVEVRAVKSDHQSKGFA